MKKLFLGLFITFTLAFGMITVPVSSVSGQNGTTTIVGQQVSEAQARPYRIFVRPGSPMGVSYTRLGGSWWKLSPGQSATNVIGFWHSNGTIMTWRYAGSPYKNTVSRCRSAIGCNVPMYGDVIVASVVIG